MNSFGNLLKITFFTCLFFTLFERTSHAQVLVVEPDCGMVGDQISISGSGWAEPNPVCEYLFFLDGVEIAARQPDGLFGPPNRTFTVPAGTMAGEHTIRVELRLISDGTLLQCRQTTINVVTSVNNPWTVTTSATGRITIMLNPSNVCDITPCTSIVFIQTVRHTGRIAGSNPPMFRDLTYAEQNFPNAAGRQMDKTAAGIAVDRLWGRPRPYYGSNAMGGFGNNGANIDGMQGSMPRTAVLVDQPRRGSFPPDIDRYVLHFETNGFCASGTNMAEWLGMVNWTWQKNLGDPGLTGTATFTGSNRNQPSQGFLDALALWDANHATWSMPQTTPPTSGGSPCATQKMLYPEAAESGRR